MRLVRLTKMTRIWDRVQDTGTSPLVQVHTHPVVAAAPTIVVRSSDLLWTLPFTQARGKGM